jgi:hypothetical protein
MTINTGFQCFLNTESFLRLKKNGSQGIHEDSSCPQHFIRRAHKSLQSTVLLEKLPGFSGELPFHEGKHL